MPDPSDAPESTEPHRTIQLPESAEDVDPVVAEMVVAVRDRFGLRGLRDAQAMIGKEIVLAEQALAELTADQPG
jgi:hypothetical protein